MRDHFSIPCMKGLKCIFILITKSVSLEIWGSLTLTSSKYSFNQTRILFLERNHGFKRAKKVTEKNVRNVWMQQLSNNQAIMFHLISMGSFHFSSLVFMLRNTGKHLEAVVWRCSVKVALKCCSAGKHLCQGFSFSKVAGCNFIKKRLWHCFLPLNFAKSLRTAFL